MMQFDTILFDWHRVLCHDIFYVASFLRKRPEVLDGIQRACFSDDGSLINEWMRGRVGYKEVHRRISEQAGAASEELDRALIESVKEIRIDTVLLDFAKRARIAGIKTAIVTDNMDIFTLITVPHHGLGGIFDYISNSADSGLLKQDNDGLIFDHVLKRIGADIGRTLFIDDSPKNIALFESKGGIGHCYTTFDDFNQTVKYPHV